MERIAEAAEVSPSTFFRHFTAKILAERLGRPADDFEVRHSPPR